MGTGIGMGFVMDPLLAIVLMILWEPFEILILSPLVWKVTKKSFGHEGLRNSISDIFWDAVGVIIGGVLLIQVITPPFHIG